MLWEHEPQASVFTASSSSPKLSWVFLQLYRNTENMFSISFRKHHDEKRETTCLLWSSKRKFSLLAPSLLQQLVLVLCFYWVIETWFLTNQCAYFLRVVFEYLFLTLQSFFACFFLSITHMFFQTLWIIVNSFHSVLRPGSATVYDGNVK